MVSRSKLDTIEAAGERTARSATRRKVVELSRTLTDLTRPIEPGRASRQGNVYMTLRGDFAKLYSIEGQPGQ